MSFKKIFALLFIIILNSCSCNKKKADLVVVNVLDKELYDDCHIKGSINIPFEELEHEAKSLDKNVPVVLYCSNYMCTASKLGASMLKNMGFKQVYAYEAGMADWYQHGYPVVGECKKAYLKEKLEKVDLEDDEVVVISTDSLKDMIKRMLAVNITS
jgi:rhodanese-related sulfurtransferase